MELTPYEQGYKAYGERLGVSDNPFPKPEVYDERSDFWQWNAGWNQADRTDN